MLSQSLVRVIDKSERLRRAKTLLAHTPKFYETTSVFLPLAPGASSTGMLASRPMGLGDDDRGRMHAAVVRGGGRHYAKILPAADAMFRRKSAEQYLLEIELT